MSDELIAICVPTLQRPMGLARLLDSFTRLDLHDINVHLIIADNDPTGSAGITVQRFIEQLPFPATYVVEPARGLASVRNRLVAEARALGAEFIAFADDDMVVSPPWLSSMTKVLREFDADVATQKTLYSFPSGTPTWLQRCTKSRDLPTGTQLRTTGTGGTLYRVKVLEQVDGPFDVRLNLIGGEDVLLGATLNSMGFRIVWCNEELLTEIVPASRATFQFVARRAYREGLDLARIAMWVDPSVARWIRYSVLCVGLVGLNTLLMVPNAIRYRERPANELQKVILGLSALKGIVFGPGNYEGYTTVHGN